MNSSIISSNKYSNERGLYYKNHGKFFHEYEEFSNAKRQEWKYHHLSEIIEIALISPFYQKRFKGISVDVTDSYPLKKIPPLLASELRENNLPLSSKLITAPHSGFTVFQSGGTTGMPKTSLFTSGELDGINECNARGFFAVGLTPKDRVANLWAVGGLYMTFVHMNRILQEYGCMSFPFSTATPVEFVHTVSKLFEINVFTGITSVVLNCLREIFNKDPQALKIDKIFFGGEHIYENDRKEMSEKWGVHYIKAPGYGTVDSWYLGYQCSYCPNGVFHAFDDHVYIEIIDEDKNEPSLVGENGMLYVTPYFRKLTPIIRFRVGDRARWLKDQCSCGRTTPLFELLGRGDDLLRIGYDSVDYVAVQKILSEIEGVSGRMQMEKRRREGKDELIIRLETHLNEHRCRELSEQIRDRFLEDRPSFREFEKKGTVWPLRIEWVPEFSLSQNSRTGKLIRVIDAI